MTTASVPPEQDVTKENLITAVKELTRVVTALELTLKRDYPTRLEVRRRRYQIVLGVLFAIVVSYFLTVQTVAYCFLDGVPRPGEKPLCSVFPGYQTSFENNRLFLNQITELRDFVTENRKEIENLKDAP